MTVASTAWFGDRAVLVALTGSHDREQMAGVLSAAFPQLLVRRGITSVLVESDTPDPGLRAAVDAVLDGVELGQPGTPPRPLRTVTIEVDYDGPDVSEVASAFGCPLEAVVAAHQEQRWRVAMMGFAPGFAYLLPEGECALPWDDIPRLSRPRDRVDAGAVAVAAGMSAVYPRSMPGGWPLIGRTALRLFDPEQSSAPAVLAPGDLVEFREANA